jgi:hypothetical protein
MSSASRTHAASFSTPRVPNQRRFRRRDLGPGFTGDIVPIVTDLPEPTTVAILAAVATLRRRTRQK